MLPNNNTTLIGIIAAAALLILLAGLCMPSSKFKSHKKNVDKQTYVVVESQKSFNSLEPTDENTLAAAINDRKASPKQLQPGMFDLSEFFSDSNRAFLAEVDKLPPEYYAPQRPDVVRNGRFAISDLQKAFDEAEKAKIRAVKILSGNEK